MLICINLTVNGNNKDLIRPQTNFDSSKWYVNPNRQTPYNDQNYGDSCSAGSNQNIEFGQLGEHPLLRKKSSTNRQMTEQSKITLEVWLI